MWINGDGEPTTKVEVNVKDGGTRTSGGYNDGSVDVEFKITLSEAKELCEKLKEFIEENDFDI